MRAYVVTVTPEFHTSRVSQEAYKTLTEAQAFVTSRAGKIRRITDFRYTDENGTDYEITEVLIR